MEFSLRHNAQSWAVGGAVAAAGWLVAMPAAAWLLPTPPDAADEVAAVIRVALPPLGDFGMPTRDALPPSQVVRRLQELLQGLGQYNGEVHGRLDDDTGNAIRTYQRRAGLEDDGRATEELIVHVEFTSKAIELGARLDAARTEQMRTAEQALLAQPETRRLIADRPAEEAADITRDASACFVAPTQACLLREASESAKAVFDVRFRDWVLGEIVTGLARSGLADEAFDTAARITDPRLIVVALRDISIARADLGQIDQAAAVAAVIPEAAIRAKSLTAIAAAQARGGLPAALARTVADLESLVRGVPADRAGSALAAEAAVALARAGMPESGWGLLDVAKALASNAPDRDNELAAVAAAMVAAGRAAEARAVMADLPSAAQRPVIAALATAAAAAGDTRAAREYAAQVAERRYRVATLVDVALVVAAKDGLYVVRTFETGGVRI